MDDELLSEDAPDRYWDAIKDWPGRERIVHAYYLHTFLQDNADIVFEGAQGVMLDENYGTAPHNTWTDTTFRNALRIMGRVGYFHGQIKKIGVVRTYYTRHGAGPFPTEVKNPTVKLSEPYNTDDGYQGNFRVGNFDKQTFNYALTACGGIDWLAMNHCDCVHPPFTGVMDEKGLTPIVIEGHGPTADDRIWIAPKE